MDCPKCGKSMELFYKSSALNTYWCKKCDEWGKKVNIHPIMYPFQNGVDMLFIHEADKAKLPEYDLKLLERINTAYERAIEMGKYFGCKYQNTTRLMRILWKMGFWSIHHFQEELNIRRRQESETSICDSCTYWNDPCVTKKENDLCMAYETIDEYEEFVNQIKLQLTPRQLSIFD